jgi:hypothetical protein
MATLLEIVQQASGELGLSVPNAAATSTTQDVVQMVYLVNAVGQELNRKWEWQRNTVEYVFQTVFLATTGNTTTDSAVVTGIPSTATLSTNYYCSGTGLPAGLTIVSVESGTQVTLSQPATATGTGVTLNFGQAKYSLPSDYDRKISNTDWDKSRRWGVLGPTSAQEWQWLKSSYISTGPRTRFRILNNLFQIYPPPAQSNLTYGFEYISNGWAFAANGTTRKSRMTVDTDTPVFPDRLMILGTKLKYLEAKNFDTTAVYRDYRDELEEAKGSDADSPVLSMAPRPANILINQNNIPDSGYGTS